MRDGITKCVTRATGGEMSGIKCECCQKIKELGELLKTRLGYFICLNSEECIAEFSGCNEAETEAKGTEVTMSEPITHTRKIRKLRSFTKSRMLLRITAPNYVYYTPEFLDTLKANLSLETLKSNIIIHEVTKAHDMYYDYITNTYGVR
jgi:hypothetical protein